MLTTFRTDSTLGYSQAARVGDLLFVSGQVAVDERGRVVGRDDISAHVEQVFKNLKAVLDAGGSGLELVSKLTILATSLEYLPAIREVRRQFFGPVSHYPASTFMVVAGLARPDYLVEIEAIALIRDRNPSEK